MRVPRMITGLMVVPTMIFLVNAKGDRHPFCSSVSDQYPCLSDAKR